MDRSKDIAAAWHTPPQGPAAPVTVPPTVPMTPATLGVAQIVGFPTPPDAQKSIAAHKAWDTRRRK